jgi:cyclopropane fatty-acyl-phospholipid synthase-like methyltransferase
MVVLSVDKYDKAYFDQKLVEYPHSAGYSRYERVPGFRGTGSLGEFYRDKAKKLFDKYQLFGKKVLELGCAKGFIVEDLRSFGVDCYGLDVSPYAIGESSIEVAPYLTIGDARTYLSNYAIGEFDVVFSLRFMLCLDDTEIPDIVKEMNRISKFQFHVIDEFIGYVRKEGAMQYYNSKTVSDWLKYKWRKNSVVIAQENENRELIK